MHCTIPSRAALLCFAVGVVLPSQLVAQPSPGIFAQRFAPLGEAGDGEVSVGAAGQVEASPSVTTLGEDDSFVVVWDAFTSDEAEEDIFARRFAADGVPLGTSFAVNAYTPGSQLRASVAADGSGGFFVVWDSANQDGDSRGVFGQLFDSDGQRRGDELQINVESADAQRRAAVAETGNGFVVVWESVDQDGAGLGIFGRRLDIAATPVDGEFQVNTYIPGDQGRPAVIPDMAGGFVVAWESAAQDNYGRGIFGQRFDNSGDSHGEEFRINTDPSGSQRRPALAPLAEGGFVATWDTNGQDGSRRGVFAQRFDANGAFLGAELQVNTFTANHQQQAQVAGDAHNGYVVAWQSLGQDGNSYGVFAQRFDANGERRGDEIQLAGETRQREQSVDLSTAADGGFIAVWERQRYCPGDCDGDGRVVVGELIQAIGVALEQIGVNNCQEVDANGSEAVSIAELTRAVRSALDGC